MTDIVALSIEKKKFDKELKAFFTSATDRVEDWTEAAEDIVTMVRDDVRMRFQSAPSVETGGMVWGDVYWRPLNEGYLLSRPDRRGGQILIDTGALKSSVTENTTGSYTEINETEIRIGTTLPYAEELQKDENFPFIFWHPILLERITEHLLSWYMTGKKYETRRPL
jgi:hypothetical protein